MKKWIALILVLILTVSLIACSGGGGSGADSLVGKWVQEEEEDGQVFRMIYEFTKDGKLKVQSDSGDPELDEMMNAMFAGMEATYKVVGNKITVTGLFDEGEEVDEDEFVISGDTLKIGDDAEFKRMK